MGFRFGKSIKLGGGLKLNLSKKGVGISAGVKGARVGIGPKGVRTTMSIPGTGLSYTSESSFKSIGKTSRRLPAIGDNYSGKTAEELAYPLQKVIGNGWLILSIVFLFSIPGIPVFGIGATIICGFLYYKALSNPINKSSKKYNEGRNAYLKGEFDKAEGLLSEAVSLNESNTGANLLLSILYHDIKKDYQSSVKYMEKFYEQNPNNIVAKFTLADSYFELGRYDKAIDLLQSFKLDGFEDYENQRMLLIGRCFYEKGQYELAIEQFKNGPANKRTMNEQVMESKYWLGLAYLKAGDKQKAKTQLARVYSEDVNYKDIQKYVAELGLVGFTD